MRPIKKAPVAQAPGSPEHISIRGARQNNLRSVDVDVPRQQLVAITGVSGSGKSSLAFDTLFREGQRRFLETLSAYARQFLGRMEKPEVDHIDGLSPAIAVDQRALQHGPRSTVGTLTEIVDHLRVLFARAGTGHCPEHGAPLRAQTPEAVVQQVIESMRGEAVHVLAPLVRDRKGHHRPLLTDLARKGFVRVRVDGELHRIEEVPELERYKRHTLEVVIDRLKLQAGCEERLREAVGAGLELGQGDLLVLGKDREQSFSTQRSCPSCGVEAPLLEPRVFSFNSPHGACPDCEGLGVRQQPSVARVVANPKATLREGALAVTKAAGGGLLFPSVGFDFLEAMGEVIGFDLDTPWEDLTPKAKRAILRGTGQRRFEAKSAWNGKRFKGQVKWERRYRGVIPALERAWSRGFRRKSVERFLDTSLCSTCDGARLNEFARAVQVGGACWKELTHVPVDELDARLDALELTKREALIGRELLAEVRRRSAFLRQVGLGYLTLDRGADGLSSGEAQRIRLAAQLGAGLQGVLYVLDEPSIGLHPRDHGRLLDALRDLRDRGNTVVVVEHDEDTLRAADYMIDVGPSAGRLGGQIVAQGAPAEVARADSPTGRLLRGEIVMPAPDERRSGNGHTLKVRGATGFNLKGVDATFPLGTFTVVTGVSGSGKSTLVNGTMRRAVARHLGLEVPQPEPFESLDGLEHVEQLVSIDAGPIGRTPRSNPATYSGAFTPIRDLFTRVPEALMRGWAPGRFSFNVKGGRCESCQGAGARVVELQFLAPVTVPCEVCGGNRFQEDTLEIRYRDKNIADVLALTIEEAAEFFADHPKIRRPLNALVTVGLGYLTLGQPSTTISGGEAQRVKLAKHLQKRTTKHTLYLLDEPTTGLHGQDVQRLVGALQALVDAGHSVLVIEHNLDLVRTADWVIDLGPEGGSGGGRVIAAGTPEAIEACEESFTGAALKRQRRASKRALGSKRKGKRNKPADCLRIQGARTHNLKNITAELPHNSLTVVTGPSGSGKSSLALDTIHEAGRQRFVESLSTYARQFLGSRARPPVDHMSGLGPSVSVEARTSTGHPRSTVATTTEIHDHLRVLWARAGTARCPDHGVKLERSDPSKVARRIASELEGSKGWIVAPIFGPGLDTALSEGSDKQRDAAFRDAVAAWKSAGFVRALIDGVETRLTDLDDASIPDAAVEVELVIDRLAFGASTRTRIAEAVEQAAAATGGRVRVRTRERSGSGAQLDFHTEGACAECGFHLEQELEPRHFSFNTYVGACPACDGLGSTWRCDADLLVDRPTLPLVASSGGPTAIGGKLGRYLTKGKGYYEHLLRTVAKSHRIALTKPFSELTEKQRELILFGRGARAKYAVQIEKSGKHYELEENFEADWPGLCGQVDAWHAKAEDPDWRTVLERFMARRTCPTCEGERLAPGPRSVTLGRKRLPELLTVAVDDAIVWFAKLKLPARRAEAVEPILEELRARLELLQRVGLGYLTLARSMATLSGGEARRVRLSASLGSKLVGVCYVLDEPTVGLHPADIERLTGALMSLRDGGNTVIVVEHDETLMRDADYIVDMGPGAGRHGGEVVVAGTPDEILKHKDSLTAQALRGELAPEPDPEAPEPEGKPFGITGARTHNLKGVRFDARYGELTGVCGPSGSGKSTLILDTLVPALRGEKADGRWKSLKGWTEDSRVLVVDAKPLGRTPASVPATAVGIMDPLRELFARTTDARARGFTPSYFSFNSSKGRCPACEGRGATKVEMQFLADLWLQCDECGGRRFAPSIAEVRYRGRSLPDVLDMPVEEAAEFLAHQPQMKRILDTLVDVGLGYLSLGQPSTTLSAGEAQRVKLSSELLRANAAGRSVIVLDEPSTGLHASDVQHLVGVLQRLVRRGDAVIVIEHHTGILGACSRLVELGPGGGAAGGTVIATGTPLDLATDADSVTGPWLGSRSVAHGRATGKAARPNGRAKRSAKTKKVQA